MKTFKRSLLSAAVLAFAVSVTGCASNPSNQDYGKILGAAAGAGIGSLFGGGNGRTLAIVIGGVAGYVIGGNIGRNMDRADQERAAHLARRGFNNSDPGVYHDSWNGRDGVPISTRVITHPYYEDRAQLCRQFTQETTIRIHGRPETAVQYGTACLEYSSRYPNGMWVVQPQ